MLHRVDPHLIVYELVDEHRSPRLSRRLLRVYDHAERTILDRSNLVFASSRRIASRLAEGHERVVVSPAAAAEVEHISAVAGRTTATERLALYVGGIDHRFDADLLLRTAAELPGWTFLLAGQAQPEVRRRLSGVANVVLLGHLPSDKLPELIASAAVCLVPYKVDAVTASLFPIKIVLYLAAGRPVVSTPIDAAGRFGDVLEVADREDFPRAIERAAECDDEAARARRIQRARPYSWPRRITEMEVQMALAAKRA